MSIAAADIAAPANGLTRDDSEAPPKSWDLSIVNIRDTLTTSETEARRLQSRVRWISLSFTLVTIAFGLIPVAAWDQIAPATYVVNAMVLYAVSTFGVAFAHANLPCWKFDAANRCGFFILVAILLAYTVVFTMIGTSLPLAGIDSSTCRPPGYPMTSEVWICNVSGVSYFVMGVAFGAVGMYTLNVTVRSFKHDGSRDLYNLGWSGFSIWLVLCGVATTMRAIMYTIYLHAEDPTLCVLWWCLALEIALLCVINCSRTTRNVFHRYVLGMLTNHEQMARTLGLSALLGRCTVKDAIEFASEHLLTTTFSELEQSSIDAAAGTNWQELGLFKKSTPSQPYVFISHSWRDDGVCLWPLLCKWHEGYVKQEGGTPFLWFDKYSIVPAEDDDYICCMPIYIAAATKLVVFAGPTFFSRLWCLFELFVFIHMGGKPSDMELCVPPHLQGESIREMIRNIDSANAECTEKEDTEALKQIILAAYGDYETFDDELVQFLGLVALDSKCNGPSAARQQVNAPSRLSAVLSLVSRRQE